MMDFHIPENTSSAEDEIIIDNKRFIKSIAKLICKYNMLGLLIVYAVGTFIYVTNNQVVGFPFASLSVVQYAVLVFYVTMILFLPVVVNIAQKMLYRKQPHAKLKVKFKICFRYIGLEYIALSLVFCAFLNTIIGNYGYTLLLAFVYILAPILGVFCGLISFFVRVIIYSALVWLIILEIPVSAGGLKPFPVEFCAFEAEGCQTYIFFGETNGLYQFRDGDMVILQPTDSGYLKYDHNATH